MTNAPKLLKGGLVVIYPQTGAVRRMIALQYNPDTHTRNYQTKCAGADVGAERAQRLPFHPKCPAIDSIKLEAEIDAPTLLSIRTERKRSCIWHLDATHSAGKSGEPTIFLRQHSRELPSTLRMGCKL
jgi:hypothetical protein